MKLIRSHRRLLVLLMATAWVGLSGPAQARSGDDAAAWLETAIQIAERDDGDDRMSRSEAARRAKSRHGGRVLSVDEEDDSGYRVKLLDKGTVRTIRVDEDHGHDNGGDRKRDKKRRNGDDH